MRSERARLARRRLRSRAAWVFLCVGIVSTGAGGAVAETEANQAEDGSVKGQSVVLLHGLARSARNMLVLEWRLSRLGYDVCNVNYDTRVESISVAAEAVEASVAECLEGKQPKTLHFVTHSLGGLVLRALLERGSLGPLGRAVMLAPPNRGSELADWLQGSELTRNVMGPLAGQLGTGPSDLPQNLSVPSIPFGVIAGDRWINPAGPLFLPGRHDGTVSVESTRLEGMADHLVLPLTHTFIMNSAEVAAQSHAFLQTGRFRRD